MICFRYYFIIEDVSINLNSKGSEFPDLRYSRANRCALFTILSGQYLSTVSNSPSLLYSASGAPSDNKTAL